MSFFIQPLVKEDLPNISYLSPPEWKYDISIPYTSYLSQDYCIPLKLLDSDLIIGVANAILFSHSAWLSQIIISNEYRGKGLGTFLTRALLERIPAIIKSIQLIATDLGYPVYKKLGFTVTDEYVFYSVESASFQFNINSVPFEAKFLPAFYDLDKRISGEDRSVLFPHSILISAQLYFKENALVAYKLPGLGEGLILSEDKNTGIELIKEQLNKNKTIVFPSQNRLALDWMENNNFLPGKKAKRMCLGQTIHAKLDCIYNRIGGNLG